MNVIFLDLETTGLDPSRHEILEIAMFAWTVRQQPNPDWHEFQSVISVTGDAVERADRPALEMHARSGLLDACIHPEAPDLLDVQARAEAWLQKSLGSTYPNRDASGEAPYVMAGNSVFFDRAFIRRLMPSLDAWFNRRLLDVSALHLAAQAFEREPAAARLPVIAHRAMADCRDSVRQFEAYAGALGQLAPMRPGVQIKKVG